MDCHDFKKLHVAFVDDTLPGVDMVAMQRHLAACESCARHDTTVRRGLMLLRSLPPIEPSADFSTRLKARLRNVNQVRVPIGPYDGPRAGSFLAAAACVMTLGYLAAASFDWTEPARDLRLAPVIASVPASTTPPMANPAIVASVSMGMSMWPSVLMAEQAPMHFANAEFQLASWGK